MFIRCTEYGIPHIEARNFEGLGEGYGYAFAQDDLCTMANDYITVDGERSKFFGPSEEYDQQANGVTVTNLDSDFFFGQIIDSGIIEKLLSEAPPIGPKPEVKEAVNGYVAGYNRYLESIGGSAGVPDPRCRGAAWVRPITAADVWRRFYQLIELASGDVVIPGIAESAPPVEGASAPAAQLGSSAPAASFPGSTPAATKPASPVLAPEPTAHLLAERLPRGGIGGGIGSNAVAVGRAGTREPQIRPFARQPAFPLDRADASTSPSSRSRASSTSRAPRCSGCR